MIRLQANRTERSVNGNQGIAIGVLQVCTGNCYLLGSTSRASEHNIRGRRADSSGRGNSLTGPLR
jgi:hypothetical protein